MTGLERNLRILGNAALHGELMSKTLISAADEIALLRRVLFDLWDASRPAVVDMEDDELAAWQAAGDALSKIDA